MNSKTNTVYIIAGPTAVGKTAIAIQLAQALGTSIISADSRQCYREMTIGTAKPSEEELAAVPHYFINSHSVTDHLSTADFEQLALQYLDEIFKTNNTAVVCGGTGLYIKSLCEGIDEMPDVDAAIEHQVNDQYKANGIEWLQKTVETEDPDFYKTGEIHNPVRLIRALSFIRSTGKSITEYRTGTKKERPFNIIKIALELPREILYDRINRRVDIMMEKGLLEEATALYPQRHLKNLQTVGYSEIFDYLDGKCTLDEAIDKIKQHSRNYAKRQLTWFRKDKEFHWLQADETDITSKILASI
ncbi:MAG: tRNA (adenosine(37)-N6)-dimethylallyltransferase MiaA [Chitinophagales bacterium]|nr:tRNA (adenosine(37)-N6)-dimethylallyltransferase MiaA [Chitinophagales bacterium]